MLFTNCTRIQYFERYCVYQNMKQNKDIKKNLSERIQDVFAKSLALILSIYFRITGQKEL